MSYGLDPRSVVAIDSGSTNVADTRGPWVGRPPPPQLNFERATQGVSQK
jgi:hypothetical protein